ncbi:MAG: acetyltransferase, partial [Pseudopedobacter saltans]
MNKDLYILGAGGHSKVVIEIAEDLGYKIIS